MDPPFIIEYFYLFNKNNVSFDRVFKHQIPFAAIKSYFHEQESPEIITYTDIVKLLQKDGASFRVNNIRYSRGSSNSFLRMEPNFELQLGDFLSGGNHSLLLLLEHEGKKIKQKLSRLSSRIQRLERQFSAAQKILRLNYDRRSSPTLQEIIADDLEEDNPNESMTSLQAIKSNITLQSSQFSPLDLFTKSRISSTSPDIDGSRNARATLLKFSGLVGQSRILNSRKLDIAIMISEPLVEIVGSKHILSLPDAVDYEEECREIYYTLRDKERKIFLTFEIATRANLVNILSKNPVILHIMCHGEYDSENKKFYLCFENSDGEIDRLFADDLRDILQKFETSVQLVFVNACHSEPVAQVFADAGVPCVVAVQSQLQIADTFATKFAREFYDFIFEGKSVKEAFNLARTSSTDPLSYSCCCAHAHKPNCKWALQARREGYHKAHIYHDPLCTVCKRRRENIHNLTCQWADEFRSAFSIEENQPSDENSKSVSTCCCSPELAHNELLKFIILSKNKESESLILFDDLEPGKVQNIKFYSVIDQRFPEKRILGRNKQLYEVAKLLRSPHKIVKLEGPKGVGKTAIARHVANYLYSRNQFRSKISIIDLSRSNSVSRFMKKLFNEIELARDIESFYDAVRAKEVLYIIDKSDTFIENDREGFSDCLQKITSSTKCVKFLIVMQHPIDLGLEEVSIKLGNLFPADAARLLLLNTPLEKIQPMKYRNIEELKKTELFDKYFNQISIQTLWWIQRRLLQGQKFDKVEKELLTQFQSKSSQNDSMVLMIESTLNQIQKEDSTGYRLMLKICTFPSGLSFVDLETLSKIEEFPFNWKSCLIMLLTNKENKDIEQLPAELEVLTLESKKSGSKRKGIYGDQLTTEVEVSNAELKRNRSQRRATPRRSHLFNPEFKAGTYFWLQIINPKEEELIFKPEESIRAILYAKPDISVLEAELEKMEYLSFVSLWLIESLLTTNSYSEMLLENSAICRYGFWEVTENNTIYAKYLKVRSDLKLTNDEIIKQSTLQSVFARNEYNFRSCLKLLPLQKIAAETTLKSRLIDTAEVLWLALPTLFNIFTKGQEVAVFMANKYISVISDLLLDNQRMNLLKIKLHLFLLSYTVANGEEERTLKEDFEAIDLIKSDLKDESVRDWIDFEVAFARAVCAKIKKESGSEHEQLAASGKENKYQVVFDILEYECKSLVSNLVSNHEFETAKVTLFTCEIRIKNKTMADSNKSMLNEAIKVFEKYGCIQLEVRAHICLARLYYTYPLNSQSLLC